MMCQLSGNMSDDGDISLDEQVVSMNNIFWYLRSMLQRDKGIDEYVSHRIRAEWWNDNKYLVFFLKKGPK
jgi:hypothetical protein